MKRFTDKIAFITGSTEGIGYEAARRMASEEATVIISANDPHHVQQTVARLNEMGLKADGAYLDGFSTPTVRDAIEKVISKYGRIDVLINNVGGTNMKLDGPAAALDINFFEQVMTLNIKSAIEAIQTALPAMPAGSAIVNVASIGGITGDFRGTLYGISKAGVINLTKYVATQYGHREIRCNAVAPGLILTKAATDNLPENVREVFAAQTPLPYFGKPEDVGATIAFLASSDARFITGQTIIVDGGMICHNPTALTLAAGK